MRTAYGVGDDESLHQQHHTDKQEILGIDLSKDSGLYGSNTYNCKPNDLGRFFLRNLVSASFTTVSNK